MTTTPKDEMEMQDKLVLETHVCFYMPSWARIVQVWPSRWWLVVDAMCAPIEWYKEIGSYTQEVTFCAWCDVDFRPAAPDVRRREICDAVWRITEADAQDNF